MKEKKNTIIITIVISSVLFFVGLIAGFSMGKSSNNVQTKCKTNIEEKVKEEEKEEPTKKDKEETDNYKLKSITSDGEKSVITISLNEKQNNLVFENKVKAEENSTLTFGQTNLNLLTTIGTGSDVKAAPSTIEYKVIKGSDSKDYLYLAYQESFQQFVLIINDETNIIWKFSSVIESLSCYATLDNLTNEILPIYKIEEDDVYYYKYSESLNDQKIVLEEIKLDIKENKVTEIATGNRKIGKPIQCS